MSLAEAAGFAEKNETQINCRIIFSYCILINFGFLCVLCGLEAGERKALVFHLANRVRTGQQKHFPEVPTRDFYDFL